MNFKSTDQPSPNTTPNFERAVDILSSLESRVSPANLAFFVTPNTVLTLSGARAFCDGVFYGESDEQLKEWLPQIESSILALQSITEIGYSDARIEQSVRGENYAGYGIIIEFGLRYSLQNTRFLEDTDINLLMKDCAKPKKLLGSISKAIGQHPELSRLSNEDINHVSFGILVGYPDDAIVCSIDKWSEDPTLSNDPLVDAAIEYANYYRCPQPVYSYPKSQSNNPSIVEHEKLWSTVLENFYRSDFHNKLTANPDFQKMAKSIGLSDKQS